MTFNKYEADNGDVALRIPEVPMPRSPIPASVEVQTPDVGPERGSAVTGGGWR
jgi:hypothetical protein